ncbi:hypothetical protein [Mycetocola sp. JXN-3]|uniref:hypothetical protein n=1 Tax=Mycetocola sp. JXN-3 TaxID=2116510 RepID=UPI00165D2CF6|nr:hypothetical protein [Mycetocola sp. JXN-3]
MFLLGLIEFVFGMLVALIQILVDTVARVVFRSKPSSTTLDLAPRGMRLEIEVRSGRITPGEVRRIRELGWVDPADLGRLEERLPRIMNEVSARGESDLVSDAALFRIVLRQALRQWSRHRHMRSSLRELAQALDSLPEWNEMLRNSGTRENSRALKSNITAFLAEGRTESPHD